MRLRIASLRAAYALPFLTMLCGASSLTAETRFTIVEARNSWVAYHRDNYTVTPEDGWRFIPARLSGNLNVLHILSPDDHNYWNLSIHGLAFTEASEGFGWYEITPGFYQALEHNYFDPEFAQFSLSTSGKGNGFSRSFVTVYEATYNDAPNRTWKSFAADIMYYEGRVGFDRYVKLEIRYNSTVPEPSSIALAALGLASLIVCAWRRRTQSGSNRLQH